MRCARLHGSVEHFQDECVQLLIAEDAEEAQMVDTLETDRTQCGQPQQQLRKATIVAGVIRSAVLVQTRVDLFAAHVHAFFALQCADVCI